MYCSTMKPIGSGASIMELTRQNDPHALRNRLLACNDDVDKMDRNGNTALLIAAQNGYFTCLDLLLNEGHANYKLINVFGQNALTLATFAGSEACVRLLLSKWTYERFSKRCLTPPLCVAALKGHMELVRWFCGMYPGPEHIHTAHGIEPETIALRCGHKAIADFLHQHRT